MITAVWGASTEGLSLTTGFSKSGSGSLGQETNNAVAKTAVITIKNLVKKLFEFLEHADTQIR